MPSTYTTNNGIEKIGDGEQDGSWGGTTNTNFDLIDESLDGQVTVTLGAVGTTGSPNALTISDGASSNGRNRWITFDDGGDLGGTAYVQLAPNDAEKLIYITNSLSGSRSIILFQGTYNASRDVELTNGSTALIAFDGGGTTATTSTITLVGSVGPASGVDINGGAIDGTVIGGSSAAAGSFTTLSAATSITFDGVTFTAATGADTSLVSGTAGSNGTLAAWNTDGDLVELAAGSTAIRQTLEAMYLEATPYSGDLNSLTETGLIPLTTGASNHWATAAAGDFVLNAYTSSSVQFQRGYSASGYQAFRVKNTTWSPWLEVLTENSGIYLNSGDLSGSDAIGLIAYACIDNGTSGGFNVAYEAGCTVSRDAQGTYGVLFDSTRGAATYIVSTEVEGSNRTVATDSKTTSGFDITTRQVTTGALTDSDDGFSFMVYERR